MKTKTAQHTPGPWEIQINEFHELRVLGDAGNGFKRLITFWKERRHGAKRGQPVTFWGFDPIDESNARLIAAAPEMLQFIRTLDFGNDCGCAFTGKNLGHDDDCMQERRDKEREALIAKAEGR